MLWVLFGLISNISTKYFEIWIVDLDEPPWIIGMMLTTSLFFNFVIFPSMAEESTPFTTTSRLFTSKSGVFSGLVFCK